MTNARQSPGRAGRLREIRTLWHLNARLVNLLVLAVGVILILISASFKASSRPAVVLLSVGTSVVATAIVSFVVAMYSAELRLRNTEVEQWGLGAIYTTRADMNQSSNLRLPGCREQLDIAAFGLKGFRETQTETVRDLVRRGVHVRVLAMHPDSPFVAAREVAEEQVEGQIRQTLLSLREWVESLSKDARTTNQVELKYYDTWPVDFYFRVDDVVYIGPYLWGFSSQQTVSLEFHRPGVGFTYWTRYFEALWGRPQSMTELLPGRGD